MNNEYEINDTNGYDKDYSYLDEVIYETLKHENVSNALFSIIFVSNEEIKEINKTYRGLDRVTDVISFALEDNLDDTGLELRMLGDIYISILRMIEQANSYLHSEKRELSFLCIHGLLHLLGYDHTLGEKEEKEMFDLQKEILNEKGIIN